MPVLHRFDTTAFPPPSPPPAPRTCFPFLGAAKLCSSITTPYSAHSQATSAALSRCVGVPSTQPSHACTCSSPAPHHLLLPHSYPWPCHQRPERR